MTTTEKQNKAEETAGKIEKWQASFDKALVQKETYRRKLDKITIKIAKLEKRIKKYTVYKHFYEKEHLWKEDVNR